MIAFSTIQYEYLLRQVVQSSKKCTQGKMERNTFPDGETYHRLQTPVRQKDVLIIGGTISDSETMELYDMIVAAAEQGARSIQVVIPYFGYSTMERAVFKGEFVKAKHRAMMLSSAPDGEVPTQFYLFDLHSEGIPFYFEGNAKARHIYCKPLIMQQAKILGGKNFILAAIDAGRGKWVESLAQEMGIESVMMFKQRISSQETKVTGVNADVSGKTIVVYDDMIRTGGSLLKAAARYHELGAKEIFVVTTHGIFCENALEKIAKQGIIKKIVCTDTHPQARATKHGLLKVVSIASLISKSIV